MCSFDGHPNDHREGSRLHTKQRNSLFFSAARRDGPGLTLEWDFFSLASCRATASLQSNGEANRDQSGPLLCWLIGKKEKDVSKDDGDSFLTLGLVLLKSDP